MENDQIRKIARIIIQVRLKHVTEEDRAFLNDWLDKSEKNRSMYRRIVRGECIAKRLREEEHTLKSVDYIQVKQAIVNLLEKRRRRMCRIGYWSGVAVCLIGFVLFFTWYLQDSKFPFERTSEMRLLVASVPVNEEETFLVLEDGSKVGLAGKSAMDIRQAHVRIVGEKGNLVYQEEKKSESVKKEVLNRIVTGKEGYSLTLSDGTRVWLNGDTELEFPVSFEQNERFVTLRGEAYFEVAGDSVRPFVVRTQQIETRVLGTSFNVKAYKNEPEVRVTLSSGHVRVSLLGISGDSLVSAELLPGMQARVRENQKELFIRHVDTSEELAWRSGKFVFTDEDMLIVLHTLARWYGVNFVQEGDCRHYTFSGMVTREESLDSVLEMLTMAGGPVFEIRGDNVYIKGK